MVVYLYAPEGTLEGIELARAQLRQLMCRVKTREMQVTDGVHEKWLRTRNEKSAQLVKVENEARCIIQLVHLQQLQMGGTRVQESRASQSGTLPLPASEPRHAAGETSVLTFPNGVQLSLVKEEFVQQMVRIF